MDAVDLRRRLARSEADAAALLAVAMNALGNPHATAESVSGGTIVSLGPGRYVNRMLHTSASLDDELLDTTVEFFAARGLSPSIQVSSTSSRQSSRLLRSRGFEIDWHRVLLAGKPSPSPAPSNRCLVESVDDASLDEWLVVLTRGNGATDAGARATSDEHGRAAHRAEGSIDCVARVDGVGVACGSIHRVGSIGWLGGAATVPEFRGRGLQRHLLEHRLGIASADGYELVAATAMPESTSLRNLERCGLSVVDTQTVWTQTA